MLPIDFILRNMQEVCQWPKPNARKELFNQILPKNDDKYFIWP